jgi:hypothetical protein
MLVLPVQYATFLDTLGWNAKAGAVPSYLQTLDDEISFALRGRGLKNKWIFADDITRSAHRNEGFTADPHDLAADPLRIGARADSWQLGEPLATQLRSLIALNEARYILFPVEVRTVNAPKGGGAYAILKVVVVDARRSQVQWRGTVVGAVAQKFSPAVAADLASRLADLIAPAN